MPGCSNQLKLSDVLALASCVAAIRFGWTGVTYSVVWLNEGIVDSDDVDVLVLDATSR